MAFVTCPACARHVRRDETACPFCKTSVVERVAQTPERLFPSGRLSRAALMALAAMSVGAVDGCGFSAQSAYGSPPPETGGSGGATDVFSAGGRVDSGNGGVAGSGGTVGNGGKLGSGGAVATGGTLGAGGAIVAAYGGAIFTGGANNGAAGESTDSGADADTDAASTGGVGGHSAAPLYGLPPSRP